MPPIANQQIISDLLALPLDERAKVHAQNPQISQVIESLLSSDSDYLALPDSEKIGVKTNLGFPSGRPLVAPQRVVAPYDEASARAKHEEALQGDQQSGAVRGMSFDLANYYKDFFKPVTEGLARKSMMLETPLGNIDVGNQSIPGKIARGNIGAVPGLSQILPTPEGHAPGPLSSLVTGQPEYKGPDFFSIENAAKTATEMMLTAPFIAGKGAVKAAEGFYAFFVKNPRFARAMANATAQALPLAAYQTLAHRINESIKKGEISVDGIAKEYGQEVAINIGLLLGLHGVWSGVKAGSRYIGNKIGWKPNPKIVDNVAQDTGEAAVNPPDTIRPEPFAPPEQINPVPQPTISRIDPTQPPLIPSKPPMGPLNNTEPAVIPPLQPGDVNLQQQSPTSLLLSEAQRAVTTPVPPTQELLSEAGAAVGPRIPGFLQSAEDKLRNRLPASSKIVDDVMGNSKVDVTPSGAVQGTVPESVIDSMFVSAKDSMVGDLVYVNGKIIKVVAKSDKGITAQAMDTSTRYFVPHEKVTGKVESVFKPGDIVYKQNGEPVTIDATLGNGKVRVITEKGAKYAIDENKLLTKDKKLEIAENVERVQDGIAGPAPSGSSIFEILGNETGALFPKRQGPRPSNTIPISASTEPDGKEFSTMRHWWSPVYTLLGMNDPKFTQAAQMLNEAKGQEQLIEGNGGKMIRALREMIGEERGARFGPSKFMEGGNQESSRRMTRALVGVPLPGETLSTAEDATVTAFRQFGEKTIIPLLNERRAAIGQSALPTDYNYLFHLFPEMLLTSGYNGNGLAKTLAPAIKILGQDNLVDMPFGNGSRIEISANFWDLADRMVKFAAHETAWRDPISYIVGLGRAEASAKNSKYLSWLARHLEGKQVDPAVSDTLGFLDWTDKQLVRLGYTKDAATITTPTGIKVPVEVPAISFADGSLSPMVMTMRSLNYAAMIGFNAKTVLLDLTQPLTNGLAKIPGSPLAAGFDMMTGYAKGIATLFDKNAMAYYNERGILQSVEDLFAPATMTRETGNLWLNTRYGTDWLYNNMSAMAFMGMRLAEIVNRVSVFEARKSATLRLAEQGGIPKGVLDDPEFARAVENLAKYTTNIGNFLYGKGFKSPAQAGEFNIGSDTKLNIGPLGELAYMFNTFATHHWANMTMLARQSKMFGGHQDAAIRMAMMDNGSKEFADYIAKIEPENRSAFLKAIVYQSGLAMLMSSGLGLASVALQLNPLGLASFNPLTPVIQSLAKMATDIFDPVALAGTAYRTFVPGVNAAQRVARMGGGWEAVVNNPKYSLLATRADVMGTRQPNENKTYDLLFGYPGGTKSAR